MRGFADRTVRALSDATVGTVIVLLHAALADRQRKRRLDVEGSRPDRWDPAIHVGPE